MPGLSLTDHGTLSGSLHHYKACKDHGVIPIMGVEAYFKPNRLLKDDEHKEYFHLVLTAKDLKGWHNLMRLTSEAYSSGFYYKPCVDFELLSKYHDGVICSTACISSYLNKSIMRGDTLAANDTLAFFKQTFGDDLFIEIMPHDYDDQRLLNKELTNIAFANGIPLIATIDAHYPYKDWADTQDVMLMLATGQTFEKRRKKREAGEDVYSFDCDTLWLMTEQEVRDTFDKYHPDLPASVVDEAIRNTHEVLDRCVPFMISKRQKMPKVEVNAEKTVWRWCVEGLKEKRLDLDPVYCDRLDYEFGVLKKNEVLDYFVIVGDLCRWAKGQGIRMGIGRGSAAGCLVSYLIGITSLDPIKNGLLFERFLNPDRKGMPDIDLDFQSDQRDKVKQYLADKYGSDHVADICSHQTYKPRAAIQKICMVYDVDWTSTHRVTDTIDEKTDDPLEELRQFNETLDDFANTHPDVWKHATRVQGQVHTLSKHPGGVVITDRPVAEYMPTMRGKKEETLTQWGARADFNIIDEYGFMKIDVLGLKSLAMQEYACDLIEQKTGRRPILNELPILRDPHDAEPEVLDVFTKGLVLGLFQFTGSRGFGKLVQSFHPTWLGDLGAANAIYRPGPLGGKVHERYAKRKDGQEEWTPYHERAEEVLKETFGLIVYQEQIMKLSQTMANFSGGEADALRKAISKDYRLGLAYVKQSLKDKGYEEKWWSGCRDNGIKDTIIDEIWKNFLAFGGYGFNKSHAYAYAAQSYQDAWLKAHYPTEFYAALMTYDPDVALKVVREGRMFDVYIKGPDINKSGAGFTVDDRHIRFGLRAVKNLGDVGVRTILENQPFRSFEDFEKRVKPKACNKRAKESLTKAGAFDVWGMRDGWEFETMYEGERETLGVCVSQARSLEKYWSVIEHRSITRSAFEELWDGDGAVVGGEIIHRREIKTRNLKNMGFLEIQFGAEIWNCTLFPDQWKEYREFTEKTGVGRVVMVQGRKDTRPNGETGIIVDAMCGIEELAMALAQEN